MIDDLRHMAVYVAVIDAGSFSDAGKRLSLSPSVISHHVTQLENKHSVVLLRRSTRKLSPTPAGLAFYRHAKSMVEAARVGLNSLQERSNLLCGELRVSLPAALARSSYTQRIVDFLTDHPRVTLDLRYSDERVDLIDDGVDLAIRLGAMPDSSLQARKLGQIQRKLVCSPAYVRHMAVDCSTVLHPEQIINWQWIKMHMMPEKRRFYHEQDGAYEFNIRHRVTVDNVLAMYQLCLSGLGIATPPTDMVHDDIASGRLLALLPDWRPDAIDIHAVWLPRMNEDSLTMAFLNALVRN